MNSLLKQQNNAIPGPSVINPIPLKRGRGRPRNIGDSTVRSIGRPRIPDAPATISTPKPNVQMQTGSIIILEPVVRPRGGPRITDVPTTVSMPKPKAQIQTGASINLALALRPRGRPRKNPGDSIVSPNISTVTQPVTHPEMPPKNGKYLFILNV